MNPVSEISQIRKKSLADSAILSRAIVDSFRKLNPARMAKNPVMFVVEVGAALTTLLTIRDLAGGLFDLGFYREALRGLPRHAEHPDTDDR